MIDLTKHSDFEAIMPYPKCPHLHCGSAQVLDATTYAYWDGILVCDSCGRMFKLRFGDKYAASPVFGSMRHVITDGRGITLLSGPEPIGDPELLRGLSAPPVPKDVFDDFQEAVMCLTTGSPRGAAMLCRHVVQHVLLLHDIPDSAPERMLNIAASRTPAVLSEVALRLCRAITFIGGKASHPQANITQTINESDARQGLLATRRVLLELYDPEGIYQ